MQYQVQLAGATPDLGAVEKALQSVDPAALVDVGSQQQVLRVAAAMDATQLLAVLGEGGLTVSAQVERVASECCGGCGG